jgi:hypothetical protein
MSKNRISDSDMELLKKVKEARAAKREKDKARREERSKVEGQVNVWLPKSVKAEAKARKLRAGGTVFVQPGAPNVSGFWDGKTFSILTGKGYEPKPATTDQRSATKPIGHGSGYDDAGFNER